MYEIVQKTSGKIPIKEIRHEASDPPISERGTTPIMVRRPVRKAAGQHLIFVL